MIKRQSTRRRHLVEALRSGEYTQTHGALHRLLPEDDDPVGHCCLGVACEVAIKDGLKITRSSMSGTTEWFGGRSGSLPESVRRWYGFSDGAGHYGDDESVGCLLADNDERDHTFEDIARTIEAEPDGLFES